MFTIITGACSNGKSSIAEDIATSYNTEKLYYIATMHTYNEEGELKAQKHRDKRKGKGFTTIEQYTDVASVSINPNSTVLLECLSNLVSNEMYDEGAAGENCIEKIVEDIKVLKSKCKNLVIVTNEVFSDGEDYNDFCKKYIYNQAKVNVKLVELADEFYESVVGIAICHKKSNNKG